LLLLGALVGGEDDAQPGRVEELEIFQIEHDGAIVLSLGAPDLLAERRGTRKVQFAVQLEYDPIDTGPYVDAEALANVHERDSSGADRRRSRG
jgi:hypothetical protein